MLRKISLLLLVAVFGLGLMAFAGCGDDEDEGSGGGSTTTEQTETTDTTETTEEETPEPEATEDSGDTGDTGGDISAQAVEQCKTAFNSAGPQVPEDAKADIDDLCEKAASGDTKGAQEAARSVCKKIIEANVPEGTPDDVIEQGLDACESAVPAG